MCRAHISTNRREVAHCKDSDLVAFCESKENCRRELLLRALGSTEHLQLQSRCCDVCTPFTSTDGIDILQCFTKRRPQQRVFCQVNSIKKYPKLLVSSNLGFKMFGKEMVLSSDCIVEICKISKYVCSEDDLKHVYGLRKSLTNRVYGVIVSYFS